jgi:mannose-1-phosphate guanylyltransferase
MKKDNFVVIMAGGIGSRFWPYSRNSRPKQFLDVLGTGMSLLQMTYERFLHVAPSENIYVVTNACYADLVSQQLPDLSADQILLEPARRNTAPCIAYASYKIRERNPQAKMVVTPSDHAIFRENEFEACIEKGLSAAGKADCLVTLGIRPSRPETGYGYIQYEPKGIHEVHKVKTFTEKPHEELARKFMESGEYVWNSGMFLWGVDSIVKAFEKYLPDMAAIFEGGRTQLGTPQEQNFINQAYAQCENISIDFGIMEKADNVFVVLGEFGWSDLGSWHALHEIKTKDERQNVLEANALVYDSSDCFIKGPDDKLMIVQGLNNYLVAECGNVLLVCEKDQVHRFKQYIKDVENMKGTEFL